MCMYVMMGWIPVGTHSLHCRRERRERRGEMRKKKCSTQKEKTSSDRRRGAKRIVGYRIGTENTSRGTLKESGARSVDGKKSGGH